MHCIRMYSCLSESQSNEIEGMAFLLQIVTVIIVVVVVMVIVVFVVVVLGCIF